jgi:DNA-binding Lrp family transcriptional regulator
MRLVSRSAVRAWRHAAINDIPSDAERRGISIRSLSDALHIPYETVRSQVNALFDEGVCLKMPKGVVASTAALQSDRAKAINEALHSSFRIMIHEVTAVGFDFRSASNRPDSEEQAAIGPGFDLDVSDPAARQALDWIISEFFLNAVIGGSVAFAFDFDANVVFATVMAINGEHLNKDKTMAWRYSRQNTPVPEDYRRPATMRNAAARLNIDKETVRRHAQILVRQGRLIKVDGGYLASMDYLQSPCVYKAAIEITRAFYRMVDDLMALGA